jgi:hypothetical protein
VPRTKNKSKKPVARFCGDCGYKLAADGDGRCPMCPRFEQLRMELTVPRHGEHASPTTHRPTSLEADVPGSAERRPTAAEYRAIIAAHRARSGSTGGSAGAVIGNRALIQPRAAPKEDRTAPPPEDSTGQPSEEAARLVAADPKRPEALPTPVARPTRQARAVGDDPRSSSFRLMSSQTAIAVATVLIAGVAGGLVAVLLGSLP